MKQSTPSKKNLYNNPFTQLPFFGRQPELQQIYSYLLSDPPQSCALIGETFIGKTTLLRHLLSSQENDDSLHDHSITFAYIDCVSYSTSSNLGFYASVQFWWNLYISVQKAIKQIDILPSSTLDFDSNSVDIASKINVAAFKIKNKVEEIIRQYENEQQGTVVILLDNFEGVSKLPLRDSEWLRTLMQQTKCAFVVTSRYQLYLLKNYHPEKIVEASPLWNAFGETLYLSLFPEEATMFFLKSAKKEAGKYGSIWQEDDITRIRFLAGRHPKLLNIVCKHFFNYRLSSHNDLHKNDELLNFNISREAEPIYRWLWNSLSDPELREELGVDVAKDKNELLSPHQQVFLAIAQGQDIKDSNLNLNTSISLTDIINTLKQRGFIEQYNGVLRVFSEIMRQFVLKQTHPNQEHSFQIQKTSSLSLKGENVEQKERDVSSDFGFTKLEGQVYNYLKSHNGMICSREEIKRAIWKDKPPTDSALQKIIERIRMKIEPKPDDPYYLVAVRGQGYMLRNGIPAQSSHL